MVEEDREETGEANKEEKEEGLSEVEEEAGVEEAAVTSKISPGETTITT